MIKLIIVISIFLESLISRYIPINSFFLSLFTLSSLVLIYPFYKNKINDYYKLAIFVGLIYDVIFSNVLFFNMILFLISAVLIVIINKILVNNVVNVIIITLVTIISYNLLSYILLVILGYKNFDFNYWIKIMSSSILLNIFYNFIFFILLEKISSKYNIYKVN